MTCFYIVCIPWFIFFCWTAKHNDGIIDTVNLVTLFVSSYSIFCYTCMLYGHMKMTESIIICGQTRRCQGWIWCKNGFPSLVPSLPHCMQVKWSGRLGMRLWIPHTFSGEYLSCFLVARKPHPLAVSFCKPPLISLPHGCSFVSNWDSEYLASVLCNP